MRDLMVLLTTTCFLSAMIVKSDCGLVQWMVFAGTTEQRSTISFQLVNAVFQDREHQFWFATWDGGVVLYDAYSISIFDLGAGFPKDDSKISQMRQD